MVIPRQQMQCRTLHYTFTRRNVTRPRHLRWRLPALLVWFIGLTLGGQAQDVATFTIAILPPQVTDETGDTSRETVWTAVEQAFGRAGLTTLPRAQVQSAALTEAAFALNPTCAMAQAIGARIGGDGYLLTRLRRREQSTPDRQTVIGGWLDLFAVDTRTGQLVASRHLAFIEDKSGLLPTIMPRLDAVAIQFGEQWRSMRKQLVDTAGQTPACAEALDLRDGDLPPATTAPVPLTRPRPVPTEAARQVGIVATISAEVCVDKDGRVQAVTVTQWAGYGLEDAVEAALRGVRFKPATQHGKPVAARFLAVFNFRTVLAGAD